MEKSIEDFKKIGIVAFSVFIGQYFDEGKNIHKKHVILPAWQKMTLKNNNYKKIVQKWKKTGEKYELVEEQQSNGIALKTGKETGIFVLDIDNLDHWKTLLKEEDREEPQTVKAISGSGGYHYYFKYTDELENIPSRANSIKDYDIDVRSNGGCIFAPPTKYYNNNLKKDSCYKWENSIFENELSEVPKWIIKLCLEKVKEDAKRKPKPKPKQKKVKKDESESESESEEEEEEEDILDDIIIENQKKKYEKPTEENIKLLFNGLSPKRWETWDNWRDTGMIFVNEDLDMDLFDEISKKHKGYDKENNEQRIKTFKKQKHGLKIGTAFRWLKEDNYNLWVELQSDRLDFWNLMHNYNIKNVADFYYNLNRNSYLRCSKTGWYEYNEFNILKSVNSTPVSLLYDVSDRMMIYIEEQKKYVKLNDQEFTLKMKILKKNNDISGNPTFAEGVIKYLTNLYTKVNLYEIIDSNMDLLCFDNQLYDMKICKFRDIQPNDYVCKTTRYKINTKSNKTIREEIDKIFWSIFEDNDVINYWKITTGLSLFTTKLQKFYMHTGTGRNGKGVLSKMLEHSLGEYFFSPENTFLTTVLKGNSTNSSLAKCRGTRHIRVLEPDDGSNNSKINEDFVKQLSGGGKITTRDLYSKVIDFLPTFTVNMECNTKPKLGKFEIAIKERFRIIPYKFNFVDVVTKKNEKIKDYDLYEKVSNIEWYNEFILMLIEIASNYKNVPLNTIITPKAILNETQEYFDDNNPVKDWIEENLEITTDEKDRIKSSVMFEKFLETSTLKLTQTKFTLDMKQNNLTPKRLTNGMFFSCVKFINE